MTTTKKAPAKPRQTDEERAAKVAALHARLDSAVTALRSSDDWKRALAQQSRFHNYSFGNMLLIIAQRPDATRVAGFNTWKSLGRLVRKGEKGIMIQRPIIKDVPDPVTGVEERKVVGFGITYVFDVSQTDGEPLADLPGPVLLQGEAPEGLWDALSAQVVAAGYTVERGETGAANGYTQPATRSVVVKADLDDAQAAKTLCHELAHVLLHCDDTWSGCRADGEVEAESVAFIVMAHAGVTSDDYSFGYIAGWAKDSAAVLKTGQRVQRTARKIIDGME